MAGWKAMDEGGVEDGRQREGELQGGGVGEKRAVWID